MASRAFDRARMATRGHSAGLLVTVVTLVVSLVVLWEPPPEACEPDDTLWDQLGLYVMATYLLIWVLTIVAYFTVPRQERTSLRRTRWLLGLGPPITLALFLVWSFGVMIVFYDCNH